MADVTSEVQKTAENGAQTQNVAASVIATTPKIKHDFYQTPTNVIITIPLKNMRKEEVHVQTSEKTLNVSAKLPSGNDYSLEVNLAYPIDDKRTEFTVTAFKIEIKLFKKDAIQWMTLDAKNKPQQPPAIMNKSTTGEKTSYPSSSLYRKDWNKVEAEIAKDEKENKEEVDANSIFSQLYKDASDETKRAMNKSYSESGGTVLSMDWNEVSKKKVELQAPDGMEFKKYD
ncbi:unnamed protein product [Didymodactylos carnosus]|uniref:SGT1 n=1 Tax=Didymodactylos carnosus TaxID=1234261 RepID=A0A814AWE5_9BILA|nr:unnamed protein product [Didymodactylos carnosus]CAF0919963.1 unnamed protein product [Didymodactylos carnosus]CAF3533684.1 unnamed protein product [Didymodactylos carnosus]CAF3699419.1 unnamed protein product [Didymodactylos carnosus]